MDRDEATDGTREISIRADALDAAAFDDTIGEIAEALGRFGDTERTDVRRAKAVGVIADPQGTLDLIHDTTTSDTPGSADPATTDQPAGGPVTGGPVTGGPVGSGPVTGQASGADAKRRGSRRPRVVLYLHLHQDAIASTGASAGAGNGAARGVGRVEGLGPVTVDQIREWVGRSEVVIKPVLDLDGRASVDAYEVPDRIAETVFLRNPCCPFPWCDNLSRHKDNDHIVAYLPPDDGGPPGQTAPDKLAQPCRRHHRLRTHGGWSYTMLEPGLYLWRSPTGRRYLVDHTGTTTLTA